MIGYIRVSDSRKVDGEPQREAIKAYASTNDLESIFDQDRPE